MSKRYDEQDDDDRYAERDEDSQARRNEYDYERERYGRGDYSTTRGYRTQRGARGDYERDYDRAASPRDPGYERQDTYGGYERSYGRDSERDSNRDCDRGINYGRGARRDYGRAYRYARDYGRDYERDERDYYGARDYDYERGPRSYDYDERRGDWPARRRERAEERPREARGGRERGWWDRVTDEVASWFGDEEAERRRLGDERQRGANYRGRGPRGYRRSDERIEEDINDRLTDHPYLDATDIEVIVDNGEVTLNGTVDSRHAKRIAEDIAESVSGITNVENRLRVQREEQDTTTPTATTTDTKALTATTDTPPPDTATSTKSAAAGSSSTTKK